MTPLVLETTVRLPDIFSMLASMSVVIGVVLWVKLAIVRINVALFNSDGDSKLVGNALSISRLEHNVFNDKGEPRLVSFEAHDRMQESCRVSRMMEATHQNESINRMIVGFENLDAKIDKLQKCITYISLGGKPEDC